MPVWPNSLAVFGIILKAKETEWRLRRSAAAGSVQRRTFAGLVRRLSRTTHWKSAGIEAGMSYEQFRVRVPLQTYAALAPAIIRMQSGEADVLWPGHCQRFTRSAGLGTGVAKVLPLTDDLLVHFRHAAFDALALHTIRMGQPGAFRGRQLLCGPQAALAPWPDPRTPTDAATAVCAVAALALPQEFAPRLRAAEPAGTTCRGTPEPPAENVPTRDVTLLAGLPHRLIEFTRAHGERVPASGTRSLFPRAHWPKLECVVHGGAALAPYADELRAQLGPNVQFHEVYAAAEAFLAAQEGESGQGLRILADRGVHYEFLPMSDLDAAPLEQLGPRALPLEAVALGTEYAVVVTTPGGLARYLLDDSIRFVARQPARLLHVGRTTLRLNAKGENTTELDLSDALARLCRKRGWHTVHFHVAPQFAPAADQPMRPTRHEWWIELLPGTTETPMGPPMALELDSELQRINAAYAAARRSAALGAPVVRLVMPGVFARWRRDQGQGKEPSKFARCRPDRLIADELASITQFAAD
jgi:hypothetical protein